MVSKVLIARITNQLLREQPYNLSFANKRFSLNLEMMGLNKRLLFIDNTYDEAVGYMVFEGPKFIENPFCNDSFLGFESLVDCTCTKERLRNKSNKKEASNCALYLEPEYRESSHKFIGISKVIATTALSLMIKILKRERTFDEKKFFFANVDSRTNLFQNHYQSQTFQNEYLRFPNHYIFGTVKFPEYEISLN